jgi:hypothetical protein
MRDASIMANHRPIFHVFMAGIASSDTNERLAQRILSNAAIICRNRTGVSCCGILHFGLLHYPGAEIRTQELWFVQIHLPSQQLGQFLLHRKECQPRDVARLEFHQHIKIAVRPGIAMQY